MNLTNTSRTDLQAMADDAQAKLGRAEAEIEAVKAEMAARLAGASGDVQQLRTTLGQVRAEIARREALDAIVPTISDHALLRYIERVHGIDVDAMKAELLTPALVQAIKLGASGMKVADGTFVIKGSTVITFLAPEMRPKHRTQRGLVAEDADGLDGIDV